MNFEFYKPENLIKSRVVVFCNTIQECDKMDKLGWNATTLIDPENPKNDNIGRGWMTHLLHSGINHQGLFKALHKSRVVFFPHQNSQGECAVMAMQLELLDKIIDLRIVDIPTGQTLMSFFSTFTSLKETIAAIAKLIDHAIPISTFTMGECHEDLRSLGKHIKFYSELHGLSPTLADFESAFRQMARQESNKRIKERMPELLEKSR